MREVALPKGWVHSKISDAADVKGGKRLPKGAAFHNGITSYPYIRVTDFSESGIDINKLKYIDEVTYNAISNYIIEKNDLYISIAGTIGLVGSIPKELDGANLTENAAKICNIRGFDKRYLQYFLNSSQAKNQFIDKTVSSGQPKLALFRIRDCDLSVAPLAEQKQVASKLDELLAQVDTLKTRLDTIPTILKRFRQSVLTAAVSGKLTEEWRSEVETSMDNWNEFRLEEVCCSVSDGDHQAPPKAKSGIPFLVISNVSGGKIELRSVGRWVPEKYFDSLKSIRVPKKNDILYTVTGSYGIPVLVENDEKFCFQRHIAIIKPDTEKVYYRYLFFALSSFQLLAQAHKVATGTAQKTVPLTGLRRFQIPCPSLSEQTKIVRRVEQYFALADQIEQRIKDAQKRVNNLTQSILAKAFRGELTADWREQNPDLISGENSAEALLQKIKAERESLQTVKKKRAVKKKKAAS